MIAAVLAALLRRWLAHELPTLDRYAAASCGADRLACAGLCHPAAPARTPEPTSTG